MAVLINTGNQIHCAYALISDLYRTMVRDNLPACAYEVAFAPYSQWGLEILSSVVGGLCCTLAMFGVPRRFRGYRRFGDLIIPMILPRA
jgi:hypothetical protein